MSVLALVGAALLWWSDYSPPYRLPTGGRSRIFASGNRAGRCRWWASFLGDFLFLPPLHSDAARYSSALKTSSHDSPAVNSGREAIRMIVVLFKAVRVFYPYCAHANGPPEEGTDRLIYATPLPPQSSLSSSLRELEKMFLTTRVTIDKHGERAGSKESKVPDGDHFSSRPPEQRTSHIYANHITKTGPRRWPRQQIACDVPHKCERANCTHRTPRARPTNLACVRSKTLVKAVHAPECKGEGNGRSRENPLISGIVRHDSHMRERIWDSVLAFLYQHLTYESTECKDQGNGSVLIKTAGKRPRPPMVDTTFCRRMFIFNDLIYVITLPPCSVSFSKTGVQISHVPARWRSVEEKDSHLDEQGFDYQSDHPELPFPMVFQNHFSLESWSDGGDVPMSGRPSRRAQKVEVEPLDAEPR
ncbi:hypothetical protein PR048_000604 [Dryococelus australis]|uniref:Uncharacterized protein n=1 Tax=Dryococelus australis TaxID=614101 RepID=A0ABQ9IF45_9NEOP|nr:hypothetical protein PR048_000604 [Dryococelus australis]